MPREMTVVPYDEGWPALYEAEKAALRGILGNLIVDIQHFGSTAVRGMSAKPVIDVMVVVEDIADIDTYESAMAARGYTPRGENGITGRRYFVRLAADGENHAAHIHIYQRGNAHIADELMFRDYLSADRAAFEAYEAVKRAASERHRHNPAAYTDAKHDCVVRIMEKARAYYGGIEMGD